MRMRNRQYNIQECTNAAACAVGNSKCNDAQVCLRFFLVYKSKTWVYRQGACCVALKVSRQKGHFARER